MSTPSPTLASSPAPNLAPSLASSLLESASAVAALGESAADIATDIGNGILLCRYHHMLTHNQNWQIIHDTHGHYWLKPPKEQDPNQSLIEMPTKNPLIAAMSHTPSSDTDETRSVHGLAS